MGPGTANSGDATRRTSSAAPAAQRGFGDRRSLTPRCPGWPIRAHYSPRHPDPTPHGNPCIAGAALFWRLSKAPRTGVQDAKEPVAAEISRPTRLERAPFGIRGWVAAFDRAGL